MNNDERCCISNSLVCGIVRIEVEFEIGKRKKDGFGSDVHNDRVEFMFG